jgi:glycosyltransferase involved in cell wall biosynthesis
MKIGISAIHVCPGKSGSHQPYLVNLVGAMSKLETPHEFMLFVTPANQYLFENSHNKMEFVVYPKLSEKVLPRIFFEQMGVPLDAYRRKIDVLHYPGTTASFLLRRSDVVTVHHDSVTQRKSMSNLRNIYYDGALKNNKKAGRIIAPSQVYAEQLIRYFGYRPEQVRPVHHGVSSIFRDVPREEVEKFRKKYEIEPGAILTVTNTHFHKNIPNLLRAYHLLMTRYHLTNRLVMVGYIHEAELMQIISDISDNPEFMRSHITVIPFLPHEQLPPIYSAATVFVLFSKVETFGMPLVEAMACGLPIVASDIPIHREIVQNAGSWVSPDAPDLLAEVLQKILTNKEYRGSLAQSALSRSQRFSWEKTARQTLQVYEDSWNSLRENL